MEEDDQKCSEGLLDPIDDDNYCILAGDFDVCVRSSASNAANSIFAYSQEIVSNPTHIFRSLILPGLLFTLFVRLHPN